MRRDERDDVAPAKSPLSTSAVRRPRSAASRAIPAPVIPPPMTSTSTGSAAIDASARARVRCENGVSAANSPPLGADASFRPGAKGECNAGWKRTSRGGRGRMSHTVLQGGQRAEASARRRSRAAGGARARAPHESRRRGGRPGDLGPGRPVGPRPQRRPRGEPAAPVPEGDPRLLPQPCLRLRQPGRHGRVRPDRAGPRGRDPGGGRGEPLGHSDPGLAPPRRHPGRGKQGQDGPAACEGVREDPAARPDPRVAGDRRALHRRNDGPIGREDGQGKPHLPRGPDRWALRSHQLAAQGGADGRLTAEIVPVFPSRPGDPIVTEDNGVRRDTSLDQMAKLKPVFDRRYGSVTAANSSPLTDGASAVLLMSGEAARALGYEPLAYVRSYAVGAVDPGWQLLQAPVFTVPRALERAGVAWKDLGLIEIHEAFAAQVLSNLKGFEERGWEINEDIINVMGGSIAIGHPFGATGGRLVTTLANEMKRRDVQFGLISVCAQGGMASAIVLERR